MIQSASAIKDDYGIRMSLSKHWPEYLMEGAELGIFMISAAFFTVLIQHPSSFMFSAIGNPFLRRAVTGLAMGSTAIAIIYSPWGKQSGAHFNPAVTLTFLRSGKIRRWDALFYCGAQFVGGFAGITIAGFLLGSALADPSVQYAATFPGPQGVAIAFGAEIIISFILMSVVLRVSNNERYARKTGIAAGGLVALFITFESPLSGMSMNPARTLASALPAHLYAPLWIYFLAPPIGMLAASEVYRRLGSHVGCAKLHHQNNKRCIFCGEESRQNASTHINQTL